MCSVVAGVLLRCIRWLGRLGGRGWRGSGGGFRSGGECSGGGVVILGGSVSGMEVVSLMDGRMDLDGVGGRVEG